MKDNTFDLSEFCDTAEDNDRPYLAAPFSRGAFTFATDGRILVRVPRREEIVGADGVPEIVQLDCERFAAWVDCDLNFSPMPLAALPDWLTGATEWLDFRVRYAASGVTLDGNYVDMLQRLPGPLLVRWGGRLEPQMFRFAGGVAVLMPMDADPLTAPHLEVAAWSPARSCSPPR